MPHGNVLTNCHMAPYPNNLATWHSIHSTNLPPHTLSMCLYKEALSPSLLPHSPRPKLPQGCLISAAPLSLFPSLGRTIWKPFLELEAVPNGEEGKGFMASHGAMLLLFTRPPLKGFNLSRRSLHCWQERVLSRFLEFPSWCQERGEEWFPPWRLGRRRRGGDGELHP